MKANKELIDEFISAHAENRWMDASELEALLTEFAEKLKEPASEDLERCVVEQMEADGDVDDFVRRGIDDIASKYAQLGAQWQREQDKFKSGKERVKGYRDGFKDCKEQMMKDAIEAEVYGVQLILQDGIPKGLSDNDKVKVIIIKE